MRIRSLDAQNVPPVKEFRVESISDVLVIAGPNGVGKTRLIAAILQAFQNPNPSNSVKMQIEATSPEERAAWGQDVLNTGDAGDVGRLVRTLQASTTRTSAKSSVFQFESDRTIQQVQPYQFTWDATDPWLEHVGWNFTFGRLRDRFQDTLHSIFRKVRTRREDIATRVEEALRRGVKDVNFSDLVDPLAQFKTAFAQLLAPKQLVDPDPKTQQLHYNYEDRTFPITELSSGEREVINIVFDTLLRNPSHSIIVFDEPELHLHPELSYKLIQTLKTIGSDNQFIFCTHSAEIITASLDNTVVFIAPPRIPAENQAIVVREDDETHQALRMMGQSIGIVALGKKLVLIEGAQSSLDKQTYGAILRSRFPGLVLVPSGGKATVTSFETVIADVLQRTIWGVQFFMLCDRDAVSLLRRASDVEAKGNGRLRVLGRYHLENYFLDEHLRAKVFASMEPSGSWLTSPSAIRQKLRELARSLVSYAVALIVSAEYREKVGNVDLMPDGCHGKSADELVSLVLARVSSERVRVEGAVELSRIEASVKTEYGRLSKCVEDDGNEWKAVIPGRPLLAKFASLTRLEAPRIKRLYLQEAMKEESSPFEEVMAIFNKFDEM